MNPEIVPRISCVFCVFVACGVCCLGVVFCVFFVCLVSLYFFIDPSKSGYFLKCPLKTITGYECAGCGVQRAFHELLHFRLLEALKLNPLFVISAPVLLMLLLMMRPLVFGAQCTSFAPAS